MKQWGKQIPPVLMPSEIVICHKIKLKRATDKVHLKHA